MVIINVIGRLNTWKEYAKERNLLVNKLKFANYKELLARRLIIQTVPCLIQKGLVRFNIGYLSNQPLSHHFLKMSKRQLTNALCMGER